jgi:hypothetical protein
MALSASNLLIGPAFVTFGGVEMGFTTDKGVSFGEKFETVKYKGAQSPVTAAIHRHGVDVTVKVTFNELSLANWELISDLAATAAAGVLQGDYNNGLTQRALILTCPGPAGGTRVFQATAVVLTPGDKVFSNTEYTGADVEFGLIGNPSTGRVYTIIDTASSGTVPAPATYQTIAGGTIANGMLSGGTPSTITDGATDVAVTARLQVTFNTDIRVDQLDTSKIFLHLVAANTMIACTVLHGETTSERDYAKIVLVPATSLSAGSTYNLMIPIGLISMEGIKSTAMAAMQFTTAS